MDSGAMQEASQRADIVHVRVRGDSLVKVQCRGTMG